MKHIHINMHSTAGAVSVSDIRRTLARELSKLPGHLLGRFSFTLAVQENTVAPAVENRRDS